VSYLAAHAYDDDFRKYRLGGPYHWKWYLTDFDGYRGFVTKILAELPREGSLLDIGCGDGLMSYACWLRGMSVYGIDSNDLAIDLANVVCADAVSGNYDAAFRSAGGVIADSLRTSQAPRSTDRPAFACRSAFDLGAGDDADYALCIEVIEHVPEPERLLAKIHALIRNCAIITTPDGTGMTPGPYDHQIWTPDGFHRFLDGYHFEPLDLRAGTIAVKLFKD